MKARIEKKLSKRLVQVFPSHYYRESWIDKDEPSVLAYEQNKRVSHVPSVGGGTDYWGDGQEAYTVWASWLDRWPWVGPFKEYPEGHQHAMYPNTEGFKPTTRNLLKLAANCQLASKAKS
ncbi:MAG TPA: hypothetical protein DIW86_26100 [Pseudomonas sp.]|jgi:hypothetical protein|nr:hypothetical protein [Pseudomonas sp.]